jgi:uncharacterized protein (DUF2252 family)
MTARSRSRRDADGASQSTPAQVKTVAQAGGRGQLDARFAAGRKARARTPRCALGELHVDHRDPVALLEASNAGRVAELVPIRYGRMLANPFAFYRGAAAIMAHDLARQPNSGVIVQLCGDAHLANFGLFASPERSVLFGLNDFDETLPGPFDWDVRRLAASLVIAARGRGFTLRQQRDAVRALCANFRAGIYASKTMDTMDVWYQQFTAEKMLALADTRGERAKETAVLNKARMRNSRAMTAHATEIVDGRLRIHDAPPFTYHHPAKDAGEATRFMATIEQFFKDYRLTLPDDRRALFDRYCLVDVAFRVVGVGSVGTRCYVALFMADGESPLFLQVKEARASVLEAHLPASVYANHGQRVVNGQRLMQSASDIFLGWSRADVSGFDFYVRQLRDMKGSFDVERFTPRDLDEYAKLCAVALSGSMSKAGDPATIAGYLGTSDAFDQAIQKFAFRYADQNEADWSEFRAACADGRLRAVNEV